MTLIPVLSALPEWPLALLLRGVPVLALGLVQLLALGLALGLVEQEREDSHRFLEIPESIEGRHCIRLGEPDHSCRQSQLTNMEQFLFREGEDREG